MNFIPNGLLIGYVIIHNFSNQISNINMKTTLQVCTNSKVKKRSVVGVIY